MPEDTTQAVQGAFIDSLKRNNKQIRDDRATAIAEDAELQYKRKIEDLQVQLRQMKRDQENMLDLSPDHGMSLKLASDFNPQEYVERDTGLSLKIRNTEIMLDLAKKRYAYLFGGA